MINYFEFKNKLLANPEVKEEYEQYKAEFDIAHALIKARIASHMTQRDVATKMSTSQTHIARMESGQHLPTLQSIAKYAHAVNQKIVIELYP